MKKYFLIMGIIFGFSAWPMDAANIDHAQVYGQSRIAKMLPKKEKGGDPFRLPLGISLLASREGEKGIKKEEKKDKGEELKKPIMVKPSADQKLESSFPSLVLKAILISDRIRLAAIEDRLVTEGAAIGEEKVLEIKPDQVILGKGAKIRTLYLPQSAVPLKVEER